MGAFHYANGGAVDVGEEDGGTGDGDKENGGVLYGVDLDVSLGYGWILCCSLFACTTFTCFPSLISIITGLLMDFTFHFPSH